MFRVSVVVILGVLVPAVVQAQMPTVPGSGFTTYCITPSGGVWSPGQPCVQRVVVPPTSVPTWLQPAPIVPPTPAVIAPVYPAPIYVPPPVVNIYTPPPPVTLDPSIILSGRPATVQGPLETMNQVLLLQQLLAARRERQQYSAPPPPPPPAPAAEIPTLRPLTTPETGWSRAFFKPVK